MQYLAEVHRKSGFIGSGKSELRLLARQQSENNWSTLPGEEMLAVDVPSEFNDGVLVLVDLDSKRQVKKLQDATRHLIGILKNFSRMREKFRTQEEEIESWKQSLMFQSQELSRREDDIESRAEEIQLLESEAQKIEAQRNEFEETRAQILELKEEIERDRSQLEEAWARLHGEQQLAKQGSGLSDEQVQQMEDLMGRLERTVLQGDMVQGPLATLIGATQNQAGLLTQLQDQFNQEQGQAQTAKANLEQQANQLSQSWQQWHQQQQELWTLRQTVQSQQGALTLKRSHLTFLQQQLQTQTEIEQGLVYVKDGIRESSVDINALESMPLQELVTTVEKLEADFKKLSSFVADQDEELKLQNETIEELKAKIEQANEYDRLNLAADLEYEQQSYKLLNDTLQGQRSTLSDRAAVLKLHQDILHQRQGQGPANEEGVAQKLSPLLSLTTQQRQSMNTAVQDLEADITTLEAALQQQQAEIDRKSAELDTAKASLQQQSQDLDNQRLEVGQLLGRVAALQPLLGSLQQQGEQIQQSATTLSMTLESAHQQPEVVSQMKAMIMTLGAVTELA